MASPVIDVHCHVFNAADIPVKGFLTQAYGVPEFLALLVDAVIQAMAPGDRAEARNLGNVEPTDEEVEFALETVLRQQPDLREAIQAEIDKSRAEDDALPEFSVIGTVKRHVEWALWILTDSRGRLTDALLDAYPEASLFTPLMMDMALWVDDPVKTHIKRQIEILTDLTVRFAGKVHPFVAFDPERERRNGDSYRMVKDAIDHRGFIGVKLYPPLGYAATGNADLPDPVSDQPEQIDAALETIYRYCSEEEVPITAHCSDPGAEAAPGRGKLADPKYWAKVLEDYPNLHLNLAHFGGVPEFVENKENSWAWRIGRLMQEYDHVYADTGHHGIVHDKVLRTDFFKELDRLFQTFPRARERFMFGTDWHMIVRAKAHEQFLRRYRKFYREAFGAKATEAFLGGNALGFLGLLPGNRTRERLQQFYDAQDIPLPEWWVGDRRGFAGVPVR